MPLGTIAIALATILLPEMSARLARGDVAGAQTAQNDAASLTLFLTLPFAAAFLLVPQTIMRGIYVHGHFSAAAADISATALAAYGIGLPAFVLVRVLQATFYARHDTATPMRGTLLSVGINIGLKLIFVLGLHWGAFGVALGTSLGTWSNIVMLLWLGSRRGLLHINADFMRRIPAILLAAAGDGRRGTGRGVAVRPETGRRSFRARDHAGGGDPDGRYRLWCGDVDLPPLASARTPRQAGRVTCSACSSRSRFPMTSPISLLPIQSGIPGARWQTREQLHLTLRFIGEVDGRAAAAVVDALAGIVEPRFTLELHGTGQFGNKHPHALWAGVRASEALIHLQRKVEDCDPARRSSRRPAEIHAACHAGAPARRPGRAHRGLPDRSRAFHQPCFRCERIHSLFQPAYQ